MRLCRQNHTSCDIKKAPFSTKEALTNFFASGCLESQLNNRVGNLVENQADNQADNQVDNQVDNQFA